MQSSIYGPFVKDVKSLMSDGNTPTAESPSVDPATLNYLVDDVRLDQARLKCPKCKMVTIHMHAPITLIQMEGLKPSIENSKNLKVCLLCGSSSLTK